jgi:hypothetical protein
MNTEDRINRIIQIVSVEGSVTNEARELWASGNFSHQRFEEACQHGMNKFYCA